MKLKWQIFDTRERLRDARVIARDLEARGSARAAGLVRAHICQLQRKLTVLLARDLGIVPRRHTSRAPTATREWAVIK